ncbi:MAG: pyrimidine 5'-nucleotidase [Rhodobacteraceae bacterium]|nr:pyrimidine 5'-nucleotidase [Paracoccaceae bacterium]
MVKYAFTHVRAWVFDLDNTLYPVSARLFDQIEVRMTDYVMQALGVDRARADHLRKHYWHTYGTTLAGLMREHDVDPAPYLDHVHDISLDQLRPDPDLRARIMALPGRKVIYTNGPQIHAERVTEARGLSGIFDAVYGVEHAGFRPKPERAAFETIFAADGLDPARAAMFEDDHRNLLAPHEMGMACVLVGPEHGDRQDHIHHQTDDLSAFLSRLTD